MTSDVWKAFYNRGEENKTVQHINKLITKMNINLEEAMDLLDIPSSKYSEYEHLILK